MKISRIGAEVNSFGLAAIVMLILSGCAQRRALIDDDVLVQRRIEYNQQVNAEFIRTADKVVHRLKKRLDEYNEGKSAEPPVLNVLILSGGGDFGAFGAGLLQGWGSVTDPNWKRPHFDVVTGVSTGALIAPFAYLGDDDSYDRIAELYRNPSRDWINRRGLFFFMPGNASLVRIDGLIRDIKREFDESVARKIAMGSNDNRVLAIGTTNLDFGEQREWDLGNETLKGVDEVSRDRLIDILLASSAIPGAFPPVKIDDMLYADGAIASNILYEDSLRSNRSLSNRWVMAYPDVPMPLTRYWVVINGQLDAPPQITQPTWVSVSAAALGVTIRSATFTSLQNLVSQLELINLMGRGSKELRMVCIPSDWRAPAKGRFQQETMDALVDLGKKMGADPASWVEMVPGPPPGKPARRP